MSMESNSHFPILMDRSQYHAKAMNIIGIGIGISVCVLVKPDEGTVMSISIRLTKNSAKYSGQMGASQYTNISGSLAP